MTEVAGHASSVGDGPDHVRLSRIEVDMEAGAPGEAPERRHPSPHRLCGGKHIPHLPETTAGPTAQTPPPARHPPPHNDNAQPRARHAPQVAKAGSPLTPTRKEPTR